jgi:hypothetical protein
MCAAEDIDPFDPSNLVQPPRSDVIGAQLQQPHPSASGPRETAATAASAAGDSARSAQVITTERKRAGE